MVKINVGDRIKVKDRSEWPSPPGYELANSEGEVVSVDEELGLVKMLLLKTTSKIATGTTLTFRLENVEKV